MKRTLEIAASLFLGGFALNSIKKYIVDSQKEVLPFTLEKILKKEQSLIIHVMIQHYEAKGKIPKGESSETNQEDGKEFDIEAAMSATQIELEKISSFNLTPTEYYNSIIKNIKRPEIRSIIESIDKCFSSLQKRVMPPFKFGAVIPKKYLEIICNIFYFNLKATAKEYYKEIEQNGEEMGFSEKNEIFNRIYSKKLKATRNEVLNFFGVDAKELELSPKISLRIYPFYFNKTDNLRVQYSEINDDVNQLITYMINTNEKVEELIDEKNPNALIGPVDRLIDFKRLIKKDDPNLLMPNKGETKFEDQWD